MSSENFIASTSTITANKTEDLEPAVMSFKKITNRGLLTIKFSKEVFRILNVTDWMSHTEIFVR